LPRVLLLLRSPFGLPPQQQRERYPWRRFHFVPGWRLSGAWGQSEGAVLCGGTPTMQAWSGRCARPSTEKGDSVMNRSTLVGVTCLLAAAAMGAANASAAERNDADPRPAAPGAAKSLKEMQEDFLKLKFGMFIHFNLATYKGVQWVSGYHSPADFNPGGQVDTDAWADAAVSAGMKYAVLTAKHVAGFCLWDSKYTTYDVMNPDCPYQQDLVAQFIESFKSRGLKVGLYYCWRHPGFKGEFKVLPPECDPATHSLKEQNEFQKKQVAELLEKYPEVFYIWNDALDDKVMPADELLTHIRSIRQNIIASANWWDWGKKGTPYVDIAVKEMRHFPEGNTAPGETCWCLEQNWFWKEGARPKTAKQVVDLITTVNGRNSNFLLNVSPDRRGKFEESRVKVLAEIGKLRNPNTTAEH